MTDYVDATTGSRPTVGEWSYSLHIQAKEVDGRPTLVCRHMVTREMGNGEIEQRGPYDTAEHARLIAGALNVEFTL